MPKSRFNAVRERARATRHNPVGRKNGANNEESQEITTSTLLTPQKEDIIPILKSLPLDDSPVSKAIEPTEILWALTSLTGFLSNKASRLQLLAPQHNLISRILLQLDSRNHVQLRDAASGCLRNLCIEAGGKVRKVLETKGGVEICIKEIGLTAKELGFIDGPARDLNPNQVSMNKKSFDVSKPKEEMNRKEKRLAAKAEAAAAKGKDKPMVEVGSNPTEQANGDRTSSNSDDEHILLCCSHLTNLIAIVWCLAEVSSHTVDQCHKSASTLSRVFSAAIANALSSVESLSQNSQLNGNGSDSNNRVNVGKKDKIEKDKASIQLALTASNALITLTDSDQQFSAAFVGVSKQELQSAVKGKKKNFVMEEDDAKYDSRQDGIENLTALSRAIVALETLPKTLEEGDDISTPRRQAISLALLSMATLRNIQSCLPSEVRDSLQVAVDRTGKGEAVMMTIGSLELQVGLPCLTKILKNVSDRKVESLIEGLQLQNDSEDRQEEMSKKERRADEELNNINLALEILAELAGDREGWNVQSSKRSKEEDNSIAIDEEGDEEMDLNDEQDDDAHSEISLDPQDEEMFLDEAEKEMGGLDFTEARIAAFFDVELVDVLLAMGVSNQAGFVQSAENGNSEKCNNTNDVAASLRSISIRALSVLNNQYLVLASFARPPPSQPAKQEETIKSLHVWLKRDTVREEMGKVWRRQFECASQIAALPCLANPDDHSSEAQDARKVVEIALCIMWSLSRCFEGLGTVSSQVLSLEANDFVKDDFCKTAQSSLGVVDSLVVAYKSSKRVKSSNSVQPPGEGRGGDASNTSLQLSPTADGIRIHSLGILSTLVRQSIVPMNSKAKIITLLADTLEVLPNNPSLASRLNSLQMSDSTSIDAVVVAINGVIDTFADETSEWDALYGQLRLQSRLKRISVDVKSATRTIDKRKHPALRLAIDEAWSNLVGFLQYRDSLVATV